MRGSCNTYGQGARGDLPGASAMISDGNMKWDVRVLVYVRWDERRITSVCEVPRNVVTRQLWL